MQHRGPERPQGALQKSQTHTPITINTLNKEKRAASGNLDL